MQSRVVTFPSPARRQEERLNALNAGKRAPGSFLPICRQTGRRRFQHPPGAGAAGWGHGLLDWDHNAYYHRLLMRQMPSPCTRVLDVGCGAGAFAAEPAKLSGRVASLRRSTAMVEASRRHTLTNL